MTKRDVLQLAAALARNVAIAELRREVDIPQPGDLVVETTGFGQQDPDSIGWLVGQGEAAYNVDGTGPKRHVWDVVPLSGAPGVGGKPYLRWENATFHKVPDRTLRWVDLEPPAVLAGLIEATK